MPNYCSNAITIYGENDEIINFLSDLIYYPIIFKEDKNKEFYKDKTDQEVLNLIMEERREKKKIVTYSKIMPRPYEEVLGHADYSYDFWGSKWDIDLSVQFIEDLIKDLKKNKDTEAFIDYCSAWSPPIAFYKYASTKYKLEFNLVAEEPGCGLYAEYCISKGESQITMEADSEVVFRYLLDGDLDLNYPAEQIIDSIDYGTHSYAMESIKELLPLLEDFDRRNFIYLIERALYNVADCANAGYVRALQETFTVFMEFLKGER